MLYLYVCIVDTGSEEDKVVCAAYGLVLLRTGIDDADAEPVGVGVRARLLVVGDGKGGESGGAGRDRLAERRGGKGCRALRCAEDYIKNDRLCSAARSSDH